MSKRTLEPRYCYIDDLFEIQSGIDLIGSYRPQGTAFSSGASSPPVGYGPECLGFDFL